MLPTIFTTPAPPSFSPRAPSSPMTLSLQNDAIMTPKIFARDGGQETGMSALSTVKNATAHFPDTCCSAIHSPLSFHCRLLATSISSSSARLHISPFLEASPTISIAGQSYSRFPVSPFPSVFFEFPPKLAFRRPFDGGRRLNLSL